MTAAVIIDVLFKKCARFFLTIFLTHSCGSSSSSAYISSPSYFPSHLINWGTHSVNPTRFRHSTMQKTACDLSSANLPQLGCSVACGSGIGCSVRTRFLFIWAQYKTQFLGATALHIFFVSHLACMGMPFLLFAFTAWNPYSRLRQPFVAWKTTLVF